IVREYEFNVPAALTIMSERRRFAPYGVQGGKPGAKGRNTLITSGRPRVLGSKVNIRLRPGDVLRIETPGGGGFGRPGRRVRRRP
ncbi:MAG TPA: hydantoinase B/oxoprolinase family protein, partial [Acidobacteriota bacterium]|nr:hydantoinase B/oxoprolinase family protein [Acidobacteriota bacterium]